MPRKTLPSVRFFALLGHRPSETNMSHRFYVGGIAPTVTKEDLEKLFSRLAPVEEVHAPNAIIPALSRHFMIVKLKDHTDPKALAAVNKLNGSVWKGSKLKIEPAKPFFKDRIAEEIRMEAEKELTPKATVLKFNKKAPAVLASLIPESEKNSLPSRPNYIRIRRARCTPALRITEPLLVVDKECYKPRNIALNSRSKFAKHIIFDDEKVHHLLENAQFEPFSYASIQPTPIVKAEKKDKNKKSKGKAASLSSIEVKKEETVEIVKKTGQRKGFGTLLAAAETANSKTVNNNGKGTSSSSGNGQRLSQISENEMDLDDEDDDEMVRRFPMPQSNIEYAHADMSTGKTRIMSEEELAAERQRMLQFAMMPLVPPAPPVMPRDKNNNNKAKSATEKNTQELALKNKEESGRKRSRSELSEKSDIPLSPESSKTKAEKRVLFKEEGLEEIREIPRNDRAMFQPSRLDEAVRNVFGTNQINTDANPVVTVERDAAVNTTNIMPSGYADMSTLKSIFDSGDQGGIWWDDNVGKVVASASEERGQGFQNDEIFRAAEKYGIDVRMFDFSQDIAAPSATAASTSSATAGVLSMAANNKTETDTTAASTSMVFDFFGDGESLAKPTDAPAVASTGVSANASKIVAGPITQDALLKKTVTEPLVGIKAKSLADVYAVLHDRLYDTIVVGAKRFQRERSEEDIKFEWERNKQRLFNMVTKKAKVSKKQALASNKNSFRKNPTKGNSKKSFVSQKKK